MAIDPNEVQLTREENLVEEQVRPDERTASGFARATSVAMGEPENEAYIRDLYMATGSRGKWEQAELEYNNLKTDQAKAQVVQNTIQRAQSLGTDAAEELMGKGTILKEEAAVAQNNLGVLQAAPEASAYVDTMLASPKEPAIDDEDYGQQAKYIPEDILFPHFDEVFERQAEYDSVMAEYSEGGFSNGSIAEVVGGFLAYLLPTELIMVNQVQAELSKDGWKPGLMGSITQSLAEEVANMTPAEQNVFHEKLLKAVWDSPAGYSDFINQNFVNSIINPNTLTGAVDEQRGTRFIENIGSVFDILVVGELYKAGKGLMSAKQGLRSTVTPTGKLTLQADKGTAKAELAAILTDPDSPAKGNWNVTQPQVARSQMPGNGVLDNVIEDVPDDIAGEARRIAKLREEADLVIARTRNAAITPADRMTAVARERTQLEQAWTGQIRPGMSRMTPHIDGEGVTFSTVLGKNNDNGFRSELDALEQAEELSNLGFSVRIKESDSKQLRAYLSGEEALEDLAAIRQGKRPELPGNYYVEYDMEYMYRPTDKGIFGNEPVLSPEWMGRAARYLQTPSAQFSDAVYKPFLHNFNAEQKLVSTLDSIVAPIFKMSNNTKRTIDEMYEYGQQFAIAENKEGRVPRAPTFEEYKEAFPDAGADEFRGIYITKRYYDTIYDINNARLYNDWKGRGFVTLRDGTNGNAYHGRPLSEAAAAGKKGTGGLVHVYNPGSGKILEMTRDELAKLYAHRGSIIQTELPITVGSKKRSTLVLNDPLQKDVKVQPLSHLPLDYISGYYPRIYEDPYYIKKRVNAVVDGVAKEHEEVIAVAGTRAEAEALVRKRNARDGGAEYFINDKSQSVKDRTGMDLEMMQVEGRLFFDKRQERRLYNIAGGKADIVSPTNMMQRSSRMVSRQVAMEDLVKEYKSGWSAMYGDLVPQAMAKKASTVRNELSQIIQKGSLEERSKAVKAHQMWDYISLMEGNIATTSQWFRQRSVMGAEWLHERLSGIPGVSRVTGWGVRNASKLSPLEQMKHLAFIDFIVTRPLRQLVLQSSQHIFLQALDPTYVGKWQLDTALLRQGMAKKSAELVGGKKVSAKMMERNAKLMGVTPEEYRVLIDQLDRSGMVQSVNVHSFAGDMVPLKTTPRTGLGDAAQASVAAPKWALNKMQKVGFDQGEQLNVTASWLMALRKWRQANDMKPIVKMTDEDWKEITTQGSNYAMAMVRPNAASFQYGLMSVPTQFLQFTHKTFLTLLRAAPGGVGELGNKAFTKGEARRLLIGQMALFGGAGFGVKPEVESLLAKAGMEKYIGSTGVDLIAGGVLDYILDSAMQAAVDDPDLDLAFDEFLAPGANIINVFRDFAESATELPIGEAFFGAFGATASRLSKQFDVARFIMETDNGETTAVKAARASAEVMRGGMSGFNDVFKALYAYNEGRFLMSDGRQGALEASRTEAFARGLLGLRSEDELLSWRISEANYDRDTLMRDTAKEYYRMTHYYIEQWAAGATNEEKMIEQIAGAKAMLEVAFADQPDMYTGVMEEWRKLQSQSRGTRKDSLYMLAKGYSQGKSSEEWIYEAIDGMAENETDRVALRQLFKEQMRRTEIEDKTRIQMMEQRIKDFKQ